MDTIKRNKLLQTLSLFLLSGLLWCCSDESAYDIPTIVGEQNTITFSVKVPSAGTPKTTGPKTYALTEGDENEVSQIAVLLFDSDGNYIHQPIYCGGNSITSDPGNSQVKTFTIKVPEGTYDMVVLANSNQSLSGALSTISTGQPKANVLNKLLLSNSDKWNATPGSSNYMAIPMWGEATAVLVGEGMSAKTSIKLVRMVSKIDVALTSSLAKEKFNLQSVRLYNYNNQGQIVPKVSNWDNSGSVVTAPSVPSSANKLATPLLYNGSAITADASSRGVSCINEIYTFEAPIGTSSSLSTNSCIVVGGIFDGDSQTTYYRIDMANTIGVGEGATITYFPLLRNHNYKVNIAEVKASGLATPEDAFNAAPANIEASIINWNDAQITEIVFDGQYMLGVSQGAFTFSRDERNASGTDNTLSVTTDYPSGWKVDKIVDDANSTITWMSLSTNTGAAGTTKTEKLILSENTTGSTREGFVHLSSGRLKYVVKVNQLATATGIFITNASDQPIEILEFVANINEQPVQQQFKVSWPGSMSYLSFINNSMGNPFIFTTGGIPASGKLTDATGERTYTIQPSAITSAELVSNPFYERSSTIVYTIPDGKAVISKEITLLQYVPSIVPVVDDFYLMDGTRQSFGVRSNTPFTVTVKSNPYNVITQLTTTGTSNTSVSGTPIYFDIVNDLTNPALLEKVAVVTISSPNGLFPDTDITLNCISGIIQQESNSYIVKPKSSSILIPVSRANKSMLGSQLGTNDIFTAELVWTENKNRIADNSNIKNIKAVVGKGSSGYLFVEPGSEQGNAVVAIKNTAGIILWSWHIWVTEETPTVLGTKGFMDRNLGAIGNTPGALKTKGLLYQGGRKDPLSGSDAVTNGAESMLYTANIPTLILREEHKEKNNFQNSVTHPATFYYDGANNYNQRDWYTNHWQGGNTQLWGGEDYYKTVYDPCPVGWKVPNFDKWEGIDDNFVSANSGRTNNDYGGFYPFAGNRSLDGGLGFAGEEGIYWSRNPNTGVGNASKCLKFTKTSITRPQATIYRACAHSVRCIKDN